jgi:hypothetical protein
MGGMLARMMEDPGMRKMMRDQQRSMMDTMYGPLFKELGLAAEEKSRLTDLMLDNAMKGVAHAQELFGQGDPSQREALVKTLTEEQKQSQVDIKALLGDERYAQYEDYTRNLGHRMAVDQLRARLESGTMPLQDTQSQQLLQIMREESQMGSDATGFASQGADPAQNLNAIVSEEAMEEFFQKQVAVNQRVAERAATVLSAEQLAALGAQQASQLELQRMSLKMARQVMGGAGDAPARAPAAPPAR